MLFSSRPIQSFRRSPLRAAYFTNDMSHVVSISRDGALIAWKWRDDDDDDDEPNRGFHLNQRKRMKKETKNKRSKKRQKPDDEEISDQEMSRIDQESDSDQRSEDKIKLMYVDGKWTLEKKAFCNIGHVGRVARCQFNCRIGLLVVGFSNGVIALYECPSFDALYNLSIGTEALDSVAINSDGEWLAMASSQMGQVGIGTRGPVETRVGVGTRVRVGSSLIFSWWFGSGAVRLTFSNNKATKWECGVRQRVLS